MAVTLLERIDAIDFLSHCGEPSATNWATPKVRDLQSAILRYSTSGDWSMFRIDRRNEILGWIKTNEEIDPEVCFSDVCKRFENRVAEIVELRIWPKLPSRMRRENSHFRFQFKAVFKFDLLHMAAEDYFAVRGMPSSFFRSLVEPYELGHLPCGWEGEYPEGQLVVF